MNKRTLVFILIFSIVILTSCSAPTIQMGNPFLQSNKTLLDPQNPVTITLWHYYVGEKQQALEAAVEDFNQTEGINLGIIIDSIAKGSIVKLEEDITNSAMGLINADPMPQIFSSYPDIVTEIDSLDMLCDLTPYFSKEEKQEYIPEFLQEGNYDGERFLLVPIAKSTELLFVNGTEWASFSQKEGYDQTSLASWEGLYNTARAYYHWTDSKTKDIPLDGKAFLGFDSLANYIIIGNKQLGINVIDAEKQQVTLNTDILRKIFDIYYKGYSLGYFDSASKFCSDDVKAQILVSYVGSSSSASYFPTWIVKDGKQSPIELLSLPYPTFHKGEPYVIQQGAGMCVAKSTPAQQEGCVIFLKWFTNPAQNLKFSMTSGYLPVQKASYESQDFIYKLNEFREGKPIQKNVGDVYAIALHQIKDSNTYAPKPFRGSYAVRSILQSTLLDTAKNGRNIVESAKIAGIRDEDALIEALAIEIQFENWLSSICAELDSCKIPYTDR